jgi:hypothetical protein
MKNLALFADEIVRFILRNITITDPKTKYTEMPLEIIFSQADCTVFFNIITAYIECQVLPHLNPIA